MAIPEREDYVNPSGEGNGVEQHERAVRHRRAALKALGEGEHAADALVHAVLALEARVEELTCYVAKLG